MKTFLEVIKEQPQNDKLDRLTHNIPLSNKRLKQLQRFSDLALMFDFEGWQNYPPPSNSSKVAFDEINYIIGLQDFRDQWETDMVMHDEKILTAFKKYLKKHDLEVDLDPIRKIKDDVEGIILSLKRHYNRPRPKDLADKLGIGFTFFPLKTAETPSYPSGHSTQGRLVAKLIADEVPFEHRANIIRIGEDIGEGRMVAGAHYPSDHEFGQRLADELYRISKSSTSTLKLEELEEGRIFDKIKSGVIKLKAVWTKLKKFIVKAFRNIRNLAPYDTEVFTIPGLVKEDLMGSKKDKDGKVILSEGALAAIKGNYNEALVLKYLYDESWSAVDVDLNETSPRPDWGGGKKYSDHKRDVDAAVTNWDTQLKGKIKNWDKALKEIQRGSRDMAVYLNGTAKSNKALVKGGWLDNLAHHKGVNFKADIRVATQRADSEATVTGYSLKIYANKSIGLTNNTARSLAFNLGGSAAQAQVDRALKSDPELLKMIDHVKKIGSEYQAAKDDPKRAHMSKRGGALYNARQEARSPINKRLATIAYEAIKSVPKKVFVSNLLHLLGFDDKDTKMLLSVVKAKSSQIIDKHPELDLSQVELVHEVGTVVIKVVGPQGDTIVTFGTKEGERKAVTGKVSFADLEPVDLDEPTFSQV